MSADSIVSLTAVKESTSSKNGQSSSGGSSESHKITTFFPVLRPEGRAKMCASKAADSKQKEILQKLKSKDTRILRTKNLETADSKPEANSHNKGNVSVMSALKTPLSQVLRKSIETADSKKDDRTDNLVEKSDGEPNISQRAKKSFPETDSSRSLRNSPKPLPPSAKTFASTLRSITKKNPDSNSVKKRVTVTESPDVTKGSVSGATTPSLIEKKRKRRHFRGGTYSLFLSKKNSKKKQKLMDDELSQAGTENSSYLDSDDENSMMSEGLYTPSEKSLVDDEHQDSCNSPMLSSEQKDSQVLVEPKKEDDTMEKTETRSEMTVDKDESSQNAKDMSWEDMDTKQYTPEDVKPHYDDISNESLSNSNTLLSKPLITESKEATNQEEEEETNQEEEEGTNQEEEEATNQEEEEGTNQEEEEGTNRKEKEGTNQEEEEATNQEEDEATNQEDDEATNQEEDLPEEDGMEGDPETTDASDLLDSNALDDENYEPTGSMYSGDEQENEAPSLLASLRRRVRENREVTERQSTIATCVKSRQRIKRRFTDDIVDTEVGLLSLNSSMAIPRKSPVAKIDPPKDFIQSLQPVTHSEAKKGPITKIECIYNHHQEPVKDCTCEGDTFEANLGNEEDGVFCQAVDSIDDRLIGCTNSVVTNRLVRSSVKIPFSIMCEMHLWRLKHHHSCPYCGLFCSQGSFIQCSSNVNNRKVIHLFHDQCQTKEEGMELFCLHCGSTSGMKPVTLEIHMASPPAFCLSQLPSVPVPQVKKARISFSSADFAKKDDEEDSVLSHRIKDTGKVLSSVGLIGGTEKEELDRLIDIMNQDTAVYSYYTPEEFYYVTVQGDIVKVLNILAQGVDPNKKFADHEAETALHGAAAAGHTTIVHLLIQAGAVNDVLNERIYTPLMLAVENNHKDVVFYLTKNGALADFKGESGMNSLHLAAKSGNLEMIKILMSSRNVDVNSQDDGGWTPIVWASEHDHYDIVKYLLQRGANPNIRDNEENTGLHWSAFSGSADICFLYLDYGCDINAANERGDTPLHIAARQDSLPCVTLLLSRGADVQIKNKADQLPAECVIDKNSETYLSLSLNLLLKKIASKYKHKAEKILHRDISRGKETISIQCVNDVDDEPPPTDFLYVTENCETTPMNIDRTITSLQSCQCEDDCSTSNCTCASISYQCWYDKDGLLLPNFNLLDPPMLFECNRACSCWSLNCRNRVLQNGMTCRLQLIRTKGKGWGVRTLKDIPKGTFICEYVGEMISDSAADKRADDSYLFDLDNRDGETYCLDARYYGNVSRFINHLCEPNLVPVKVYVDHQDLNFPRIAFFSSRDIKQYEELGFDYCEKFWVIKYKYFTCDCGSPRCKYSNDTIHTTLANYYKRVREEQMLEEAAQARVVAQNLPPVSVQDLPPVSPFPDLSPAVVQDVTFVDQEVTHVDQEVMHVDEEVAHVNEEVAHVNEEVTQVVTQEVTHVVTQEVTHVVTQEVTHVVPQEVTPAILQDMIPIVAPNVIPVVALNQIPVIPQNAIAVIAEDAIPVIAQDAIPVVAQDAIPVVVQDAIPVIAQYAIPAIAQEVIPLNALVAMLIPEPNCGGG